jgi:hypothetical protein
MQDLERAREVLVSNKVPAKVFIAGRPHYVVRMVEPRPVLPWPEVGSREIKAMEYLIPAMGVIPDELVPYGA